MGGVRQVAPRSVAEVDVLERVVVFLLLDKGNDVLKVVALFAGDAKLVALDRDLHFELGRLDRFYDFLGEFTVDSLLDRHRLAEAVAAGLFRLLEVEGAGVDLALSHVAAKEFLDLLKLEIVVRLDYQALIGPFDRAVAAFEVIARLDFAPSALQCIVDLGEFGAGDDVEAGHG